MSFDQTFKNGKLTWQETVGGQCVPLNFSQFLQQNFKIFGHERRLTSGTFGEGMVELGVAEVGV